MLLFVIYIQTYKQEIRSIDDKILSQMKICSFDFKCGEFEWDFLPRNKSVQVYKLYKDKQIYSFFDIPTVEDFVLKVILKKDIYQKQILKIKNILIKKFLLYAIMIAVLSFLFSLYSLKPLKMALKLNDEFVKDILHDINTPISSMIINLKLLKKEFGKNKKIDRIQSNINTILALQSNLKTFLDNTKLQKEEIELKETISERVEYFKSIYFDVDFQVDIKPKQIFSNKDAFIRIIDNIVDNACKYSKPNPKIKIYTQDDILYIKDNGIGIKNPKKVFDRFYKENQRGVGIGLHIVKKLCDVLDMDVSIQNSSSQGTTIMIKLSKVILK